MNDCTCMQSDKPLDPDCPFHGAHAMSAFVSMQERQLVAMRGLSDAVFGPATDVPGKRLTFPSGPT